MVWDRLKGGTKWRHKERSQALTAAYHGPGGLPAPRDGQIPGHWKSSPTGNRGGAPIWVMAEAWMPFAESDWKGGGDRCQRCGKKHGGRLTRTGDAAGFLPWCVDARNPKAYDADPDGFAVFGRYPKGWLRHVLKLQLLGDVKRKEILHVCSGTLGPTEHWTVDIRPEAKPLIVADGTKLPFPDESFPAVMLDPPYSDQYARNLYRVENPRPSWLLKEAARVVRPGGRIGLLHVAIPFAPPACRLVKVYGVSCGVGFRIRAFTVFEKTQPSLFA